MKTHSNLMHPLHQLLWDSNLVATRMILALGAILWGILLVWSGSNYILPALWTKVFFLNGYIIGTLFLILGVVQSCIAVKRSYCYSRIVRQFDAINAITWTYVVTSIFFSVYPPPTVLGGEMALMISAIWIWIRPLIIVQGLKHAASQRKRF